MSSFPNLASDGVSGRTFLAGAGARLLAGTSFKPEHLTSLQGDGLADGFFEVHAENYMGAGGPPHRMLTAIREDYPVSLHGVGMSIGGQDPLDEQHLRRFSALVRRYEPALVSEHLAWSSHANTFYNDLLPLPYTRQSLQTVCSHIDQLQSALGRRLLLENPSTYVRFACSEMSETAYLREVVHRTGCGLLLDLNNAYVSAVNHRASVLDYLEDFPLEHVGEIHLAGHSEQTDDEGLPLLIDSHDRAVAPQVWHLFDAVIRRSGPIPTLIEWDGDVPAWATLKGQALRARQRLLGGATGIGPVRQGEFAHAA